MKIVLFLVLNVFILLSACSKPEDDSSSSNSNSSQYLYVATGACYSGGNTTFTNATSSNLLYRINLSSGAQEVIADYNSSPAQAGDSPVGIANIDDSFIYVLVENTTTTGARRIEKVAKSVNGARTLFSNNTTALSAQLRSLLLLSNGDLVMSKSTAIEKITSSNVRIIQGANPFINAPAGTCATSTTLFSKAKVMNNGNIIFAHAAAAQNRIGIISAAGYATAADCRTAVAAPNAASFPVALAYDSANSQLLVAYAGTTTSANINSIYAYTVNESANTISSAQLLYDANGYPSTYPYLLYGISEMVLDTANNALYVATAINTAATVVNYAIEKFTYDPTKIGSSNTQVLTRVGSTPFFDYGVDTRCVSSMIIAN